MSQKPALALAAVAGRRQKTIELAQEIERACDLQRFIALIVTQGLELIRKDRLVIKVQALRLASHFGWIAVEESEQGNAFALRLETRGNGVSDQPAERPTE